MPEKLHAISSQSLPDFSPVDSQEKVMVLVDQGIFLMPLELGGTDTSFNTLYVPPDITDIRRDIDSNIVSPLAKAGKVTEYVATPEYQDASIVPIAI